MTFVPSRRIFFVGGPLHGHFTLERPKASTVNIPTEGLGQFQYTLRRSPNADGDIVEILVAAGRNVHRCQLDHRNSFQQFCATCDGYGSVDPTAKIDLAAGNVSCEAGAELVVCPSCRGTGTV